MVIFMRNNKNISLYLCMNDVLYKRACQRNRWYFGCFFLKWINMSKITVIFKPHTTALCTMSCGSPLLSLLVCTVILWKNPPLNRFLLGNSERYKQRLQLRFLPACTDTHSVQRQTYRPPNVQDLKAYEGTNISALIYYNTISILETVLYNALISHYNRLRVLVVDVMDECLKVSWRVREVRDGRVSVETARMHLITFPHGQLGEWRKVVLQYRSLHLLHATTYVQHIEHPI